MGGGISLTSLLGLVFIVLKLCDVITWAWIWVLAPFWIPAVLGIISLIVFGVLVFIAYLRDG